MEHTKNWQLRNHCSDGSLPVNLPNHGSILRHVNTKKKTKVCPKVLALSKWLYMDAKTSLCFHLQKHTAETVLFFTAASQPPNIFTPRLVENAQGSASSLNSLTSKSPHLVKFSGLRDSPKNGGLGRRLGRLKPKDTLDVDVIVVYKFKQNIVGEKGSVNLTKLLPYSVEGGIFFVGKEKVESTSSLQKREGKFTI